MLEMLTKYADKFWSNVTKLGDEECWLWTKCHDRYGYGKFQLRHLGEKVCIKSHRTAYMLTHNVTLNPKQFVCHKCDNPGCNNPSHLILGSAASNMADCVAKGRTARGSNHPKSKLTESQVVEIRTRVSNGETLSSLAREFGVWHSTIIYALGTGWKNGWKHVPVEVGR